MDTFLNSVIFFGLIIVGVPSVYILSRYKFKRSILVSIILCMLSLVFFVWLGLFILGSLNRL
jgi:fucose permease